MVEVKTRLHKIARPLIPLVYPVKVYGKENIPEGPVIFVPNHIKMPGDAFCVAQGVKSKTVIYFMVKKGAFENSFGKIFLPKLACFPVDPEGKDIKVTYNATKTALNLLKNGHKLCIYAEGTRLKNNDTEDIVGEFKEGAFVIAKKRKVPVQPVGIIYNKWRRPIVEFGQPIDSNLYEKEEMVEIVREDVKKLILKHKR